MSTDTNTNAVAGTEPTAEGKKAFTLQDVKRSFYPVSQLAQAEVEAQKAIEAAQGTEGAKLVFNFEPDQGLPDGFGMAIIPIGKKDEVKNERVTIGVCIAAIPTIAELNKTAEGADFVAMAVADSLVTKVANSVRPRADGSTAHVIPSTIADFITSNRPEGILAGYNAVSPAYVTLLKNKGLSLLTKELLRQILASSAFAEQQYPKIPQESWTKVIDGMIASAAKEGLTTVALENWKDSRDSAGMPQKDDVDLSGLDFASL